MKTRIIDSSIVDQLKAKSFPHYTRPERAALDQAFARAVHRTGTEFSLFDHPEYRKFFELLNPVYTPPLFSELSTTLLSDSYQDIMMVMRNSLRSAAALTVGVDGATNVLSRSMSNVIVHDPRPWFAEYLNSNLKKESADEVFGKISSVILRLNEFINPPDPSSHINGEQRRIFAFISDSCNLMRAVRTKLFNHGTVQLTYGCSAHALNNFCEDIAKIASVKESIRRGVYVSKTIKNQNLLNKIFNMLCIEMVGKPYAMVLYSASRWSSINYMFVRLKKVKRAVTGVVSAVVNEKDERQIDETFHLPTDFVSTVMDGTFWRSVATSVSVFDPICKSIGILENNSASLGTVYASFVYVYLHVGRVMKDEDAKHLWTKLEYRWSRISSPVHALAFYCDSFYRPFRRAVASSSNELDRNALELGKGDLLTQCRTAIEMMCRLDADDGARYYAATREFFAFSENDGDAANGWGDPAKFRPRQLWTQGQAKFPVLSALLMKVYSVPASTAGVERQHKVAKRIHTAARNRMSTGNVEQQVAIAHNGAVDEMNLQEERQAFEVFMQKNPLQDPDTVTSAEDLSRSQTGQGYGEQTMFTSGTQETSNEVEPDEDEDFDEIVSALTDDEVVEQEMLAAALALTDLSLLQDTILFPLREEF